MKLFTASAIGFVGLALAAVGLQFWGHAQSSFLVEVFDSLTIMAAGLLIQAITLLAVRLRLQLILRIFIGIFGSLVAGAIFGWAGVGLLSTVLFDTRSISPELASRLVLFCCLFAVAWFFEALFRYELQQLSPRGKILKFPSRRKH